MTDVADSASVDDLPVAQTPELEALADEIAAGPSLFPSADDLEPGAAIRHTSSGMVGHVVEFAAVVEGVRVWIVRVDGFPGTFAAQEHELELVAPRPESERVDG